MKFIQYLAFASLLAIIVFACKDDDKEGTLKLHFKAVYDGAPLQTFETYPFNGAEQIEFSLLSMYISDVRLYNASAERHLSDIELVNIGFDTPQAATDGFALVLDQVPAGTYDGILFGIGVPADENAKKPADFPSSSPLSKTGNYWSAWESYIFMKTEGRLDTIGNGAFDVGFAMHTGSDDLFRSMDGNVPLSIEDGKQTDLTIIIDYKKLLEGVDIKYHPQNHTPQDTVQIKKLVNNFPSAISLMP
jgi:hypothetical protein